MIPRWIVFLLLIASVICVEQCSSQVRRQSVDPKNGEPNSQQTIPKSCVSGMQPLVDVYNFFIYSLSQLTVTTVLLVISLILLFYYICFFNSNARIVGSGCDFDLQSVPFEVCLMARFVWKFTTKKSQIIKIKRIFSTS